MDDQTMFDLFDSLKQEFKQEFDSLKREIHPMKDALERIEARLSRQGGLIQGGARQITRLVTWSEEIDRLLTERDARVEELTRRVEKLEARQAP